MTATEPRTPRHGSHAANVHKASAAWMADALGAALGAGGLAAGVSILAGLLAQPIWLAAALLAAGGAVRAGAQWLAADLGMQAAIAR